jgi:predicted transcriptional regulator
MMYKKSANQLNELNMAEVFTNLAIDNNNLFRASSHNGYVIAPQKILRCFRLSEIEKTVLFDIVSMMGERGYAFYSHNLLAFKLGKKSITTIKNALNSLKRKKFIYWELGGGDLGTNHYKLYNLNNNAYLILSEAVHYFADKIRDSFRNRIPYDKIYGSILKFVEQPKNQQNSGEDIYGMFIEHLIKNPHERDAYPLYMYLFAYLFKALRDYGGYIIDIGWQLSFHKNFMDQFYKLVNSEPKFTLDFKFKWDFDWEDYEVCEFPVVYD